MQQEQQPLLKQNYLHCKSRLDSNNQDQNYKGNYIPLREFCKDRSSKPDLLYNNIVKAVQGSEDLLQYLEYICSKTILDNVYGGGSKYDRGVKDGQALNASNIFDLLKTLKKLNYIKENHDQ